MTDSYRLELFRHGFIGSVEPHPLRRIQALIRHRAAEAEAIDRWLLLGDIRAILAQELVEEDIS